MVGAVGPALKGVEDRDIGQDLKLQGRGGGRPPRVQLTTGWSTEAWLELD